MMIAAIRQPTRIIWELVTDKEAGDMKMNLKDFST
jgi:hypothetical protein